VSKVRCVVFDVDDTLYLERDYVRSGFRWVGEWTRDNLGIDDFAEVAWHVFEEGTRGSTFDVVLRRRGIEPTSELVGRLVDLYRTHEPDIELLPDARECLNRLAGRLAVATLTDGPLESQRAKARALDLARWVDPIVFTAELGASFSKPHTRGFEVIEEMTGCSGEECVYVADNPLKDFVAPRMLRWKTVRVRRPQSLHEAVPNAADVDVAVTDLSSQFRLTLPTSPGTI
jgi:putative hydrolase of the HAD superfamily